MELSLDIDLNIEVKDSNEDVVGCVYKNSDGEYVTDKCFAQLIFGNDTHIKRITLSDGCDEKAIAAACELVRYYNDHKLIQEEISRKNLVEAE